MGMKILLVLAILPGILLVMYVYKLDRIEKEPVKLLLKLGGFGALTVISALILELVLGAGLEYFVSTDSVEYLILDNFIVTACVEEAGKYIVLKKITWKNPEFNYRFDGIVYAVAVTIGFAITENVAYAFSYGLATTLVRAFTAIPAHAIFGIFMGHYYGQAKYCADCGNISKCKRNLHKAYIVPVILHGFYDVFASSDDTMSCIIFIVLVIVLDIVAYKRIKKDATCDIPV